MIFQNDTVMRDDSDENDEYVKCNETNTEYVITKAAKRILKIIKSHVNEAQKPEIRMEYVPVMDRKELAVVCYPPVMDEDPECMYLIIVPRSNNGDVNCNDYFFKVEEGEYMFMEANREHPTPLEDAVECMLWPKPE